MELLSCRDKRENYECLPDMDCPACDLKEVDWGAIKAHGGLMRYISFLLARAVVKGVLSGKA